VAFVVVDYINYIFIWLVMTITLFYILIGMAIALATCGEAFSGNKTIKDEAISYAALLIIIQYWPCWLIIYFIKKRELKKNNK
jgi:hypothetical protein